MEISCPSSFAPLPFYEIGDLALKIACFQVSPGYENTVIASLNNRCKAQADIKEFVILKCFGRYDFIVLYLTPDFGYHLTKAEPIPGVTKINLILCNTINGTNPNSFIRKVKESLFIGVSFTKINKEYLLNPNLLFCHFAVDSENELPATYLLNTLGWSEFVVFFATNNLNIASSYLLKLISGNPKDQKGYCEKSFTYLCLNSEIYPCDSLLAGGYDATLNALMQSTELNAKICDNFKLSLYINIKTPHIHSAINYWQKSRFLTMLAVGKDDLIITPDDNCTLSEYLSHLFCFRKQFHSRIISTTTHIYKPISSLELVAQSPDIVEDTHVIKNFSTVSYSELSQLLGTSVIVNYLSNIFTALDGLANNSLAKDAYSDMMLFPHYLLDLTRELAKEKKPVYGLAEKTIGIIKKGIENRSFGTHGNIEEILHGRLTKLSGGFQRAIFAIEFIPLHLLFRAGILWNGFIILGDEKYFHFNQIIGIPEHALLNVNEWWPIYHEIAHMLIDCTASKNSIQMQGGKNLTHLISSKSEAVSSFLTSRNVDTEWFKLLTEFAAEVIGFELGFFGDIELYLRLVWTDLKKVADKGNKVIFQSYILRTFFLFLYHEHYRTRSISKEQMSDEDFLYTMFLAHIADVEKISGVSCERKNFMAAYNAKTFFDLNQFIKSVNDFINDSEYIFSSMYSRENVIRADKSSLNSDLTNEILSKIRAGKVWLNVNDVDFPYQAILYNIFKENLTDHKAQMAVILTFWHLNMTGRDDIIQSIQTNY